MKETKAYLDLMTKTAEGFGYEMPNLKTLGNYLKWAYPPDSKNSLPVGEFLFKHCLQ